MNDPEEGGQQEVGSKLKYFPVVRPYGPNEAVARMLKATGRSG